MPRDAQTQTTPGSGPSPLIRRRMTLPYATLSRFFFFFFFSSPSTVVSPLAAPISLARRFFDLSFFSDEPLVSAAAAAGVSGMTAVEVDRSPADLARALAWREWDCGGQLVQTLTTTPGTHRLLGLLACSPLLLGLALLVDIHHARLGLSAVRGVRSSPATQTPAPPTSSSSCPACRPFSRPASP